MNEKMSTFLFNPAEEVQCFDSLVQFVIDVATRTERNAIECVSVLFSSSSHRVRLHLSLILSLFASSSSFDHRVNERHLLAQQALHARTFSTDC